MSSEPKKFCYVTRACGPVVRTGFRFDFYYVCKSCRCEISNELAERIMNSSQDGKPEEINVLDQLYDWQMMFPDDND